MRQDDAKRVMKIQVTILIIVSIILLIILAFQFSNSWKKRADAQNLENQINQIEQENKETQDLIDYYNSDDYLEDYAKKNGKTDGTLYWEIKN
jgi:cell division protein FtsL